MRNNLIKELLRLHEGEMPYAYQDSLGYWTIGVGRLIDKKKGGRLRPEEIEFLLDNDVKEAEQTLLSYCPWAAKLDEVRFAVLVDMMFNLGPEPFDGDKFKDWPIFLMQVRTGQYNEAAKNMLSTLWAKQVGLRAGRLAQMMETGKWPRELIGM